MLMKGFAMPRLRPLPAYLGPIMFPDPIHEHAFQHSFAQRCLLADAIISSCVAALVLTLAGSSGFMRASTWLLPALLPHGPALLLAAYCTTRLLCTSFTSRRSSRHPAALPAPGTHQPATPGHASHAAHKPTHPPPPPSTEHQITAATSTTPVTHPSARDALLGYKARHYVLLACHMLQPCLLLLAQVMAMWGVADTAGLLPAASCHQATIITTSLPSWARAPAAVLAKAACCTFPLPVSA